MSTLQTMMKLLAAAHERQCCIAASSRWDATHIRRLADCRVAVLGTAARNDSMWESPTKHISNPLTELPRRPFPPRPTTTTALCGRPAIRSPSRTFRSSFPPDQRNTTTPRPLAHDAAANNIRAVAAPSPPRSSARLDGPPAPIPTATSRPKLRWQPLPAAAAAAAAAAATPRRGKHVWAVRKFHERPDHAARIATGPERHPIRTGIPGAKCWSCPLPRPGARLRD